MRDHAGWRHAHGISSDQVFTFARFGENAVVIVVVVNLCAPKTGEIERETRRTPRKIGKKGKKEPRNISKQAKGEGFGE